MKMDEIQVYSAQGVLIKTYKAKDAPSLGRTYVTFVDENNNKGVTIFTTGSLGVIIEEK